MFVVLDSSAHLIPFNDRKITIVVCWVTQEDTEYFGHCGCDFLSGCLSHVLSGGLGWTMGQTRTALVWFMVCSMVCLGIGGVVCPMVHHGGLVHPGDMICLTVHPGEGDSTTTTPEGRHSGGRPPTGIDI